MVDFGYTFIQKILMYNLMKKTPLFFDIYDMSDFFLCVSYSTTKIHVIYIPMFQIL
jgi:hypothetical protein